MKATIADCGHDSRVPLHLELIRLGSMFLNVVLSIAALLALLGLFVMVAVRALRKFVRSFWPHS